MRFFPEGPNIPDQLLEERDSGNVVFFCGAGVSLNAKMPGFKDLARHVIDKLGAPVTAQPRMMLRLHDELDELAKTAAMPNEEWDARKAGLPTFDQIFNVLQQEYPAGEIDYEIAKRLRTKPATDLSAHEIVLRLSRSAEGNPQLVTTNFDTLFENAAGRGLKHFVPPTLPDLASGQEINGLIYLHGRLAARMRRGDGRQGFIVSSSDFGRAYLAEGWAARFVRDLLDRYTVVLLGYSASDPPVRYLLQGLHSRSHGRPTAIYAFDSGTEQEVESRWRDSGVRALSYTKTDREHSALWNSLRAWAERADDPIKWRKRVIELAQDGPRSLTSTQRGQVASILRTNVGAKLFATASPTPPAEWLCVLDAALRYADQAKSYDDSVPAFDPLVEYGLDDDPPRPLREGPRVVSVGDNLLVERQKDRQDHSLTRLAGIPRDWADPLSPRLSHLAQWIGLVAADPVTVWWAAKHRALHPKTIQEIERYVERSDEGISESVRLVWTMLIEKFQTAPEDEHESLWFDVLQRIGKEGWTPSVVRSFARATKPYLVSSVGYGSGKNRPPISNKSATDLRSIIQFEVAFPGVKEDEPKTPEHALPMVYKVLRQNLELAAGLLSDIDGQGWSTSTFYPEDLPGETHIDDASAYLLWFRNILEKLLQSQPELIKNDSSLWLDEEPYFFDKIRLYIWAKKNLFDGETVASQLLVISSEAFWKNSTRRELLILLRERWSDFPSSSRIGLEHRIASGRDKRESEAEEDYVRSRTAESASMLGWLERQGCVLSEATRKKQEQFKRAFPDWNPIWEDDAASSHESRSGWVGTASDPGSLSRLPVNQLIRVAEERTRHSVREFVHYRPFDGLVAEHPLKAIAALAYEGTRGRYPSEFWRSALQNWPENSSLRLTCLFASRLAKLPTETVLELRFSLFDWLGTHLREIAKSDLSAGLRILDPLLDKLFQGGDPATCSGLGNSEVRGKNPRISRRTYGHAINSPIGEAAKLILEVLADLELGSGAGIPECIRTRLERLVGSPGEGRDHAVCFLSRYVEWLHDLDPEWATVTILPWLKPVHELAEPAWNGFLHINRLPRPKLFSKIKKDFLNIVQHFPNWGWQDGELRQLQELLVQGCFFHQHKRAYITLVQARIALQSMDDSGRAHCLWCMTEIVKENQAWRAFGKSFVRTAWPREVRFQTEATSSQFAALAVRAGDEFPDVVDTVRPYLIPVKDLSLINHRLMRSDQAGEPALPSRFPGHALTLLDRLVPDFIEVAQYRLPTIVDLIGDAEPLLQQDLRWRRLKLITLNT